MEGKVFRLNEICQIKSGKRIPKGMDYVTYQTNHPYIRARDIKAGNICVEDLIYLEDDVYKKIKKYIIQELPDHTKADRPSCRLNCRF